MVAIHRGSAADTVDVLFCKHRRATRAWRHTANIGKLYEERHISLQDKHAPPVPLPATQAWSPEAIAEVIASYPGKARGGREAETNEASEGRGASKGTTYERRGSLRGDCRQAQPAADGLIRLSKVFYTYAAPEHVRARLDRGGADLNEADADGNTPLLFAVLFTRDAAIVELLLASGANPRQSNRASEPVLAAVTEVRARGKYGRKEGDEDKAVAAPPGPVLN